MAKVRGDDADGGREREVRQQRLPLAWRAEAVAPPLPPPDDPVPAGAAAVPAAADAPPPPEPAIPAATAAAVTAAVGVHADAQHQAPSVAALRPAAAPAASGPGPLAAVATEGGVGDLLLSARADSGFSIQEASARTRIPRDIIEHLECNACGLLPPEYYCSAHIEKLSTLYNVDPKPILDRLHGDMLAQRGAADGLGHFRAVTTDSGSGSKISYVLPGPSGAKAARPVSLTGVVVSSVIALFLLIAVAALAAQHFRRRDGGMPTPGVPAQVGHAPAVELKEFIVTEELNAYELPIPAK